MIVTLTPELQALVLRKVDAGEYRSQDEVVAEALRLMNERDRFQAWQTGEVRASIAAGLTSLKAGRGVEGEPVFDRLEKELDGDA